MTLGLLALFGLIDFDPIEYIELGPIRVSPHGIGTAVGFLAGARLLLPRTRAAGIDDEVVQGMLWRALVGALLPGSTETRRRISLKEASDARRPRSRLHRVGPWMIRDRGSSPSRR